MMMAYWQQLLAILFKDEIFDLIQKIPEDLEARIAILFSKMKSDELIVILERLKVSNATFLEQSPCIHYFQRAHLAMN